MSSSSSDLELAYDGSSQTVGMRFTGVDVPAQANITNAWVQFTADETSSPSVGLRIRGDAADDAAPYASSSSGISGRPCASKTPRRW